MNYTGDKELTQDVFINQPESVDWCGVDYDGTLHFGRAINPRYTWASEQWRGFEKLADSIENSGYKAMTSLRREEIKTKNKPWYLGNSIAAKHHQLANGMRELTTSSRDALIAALSKELDTRDKRYMFLRMEFPKLVSRINLEGSAEQTAWNIYEEFDKQRMLGSLMACMNSRLDTNLLLELVNAKKQDMNTENNSTDGVFVRNEDGTLTPATPIGLICEFGEAKNNGSCNCGDGKWYKRLPNDCDGTDWDSAPVFLCNEHSVGHEPADE